MRAGEAQGDPRACCKDVFAKLSLCLSLCRRADAESASSRFFRPGNGFATIKKMAAALYVIMPRVAEGRNGAKILN